MVYPVSSVTFTVGTKGRASGAADMAVVKDMEKFEVSFDNSIQEWRALDEDGWAKRLTTAKSMTVAISGKRNYGDPGNDYIAGLAYANGVETQTVLKVGFPNGDQLTMPCVVDVEDAGGGGSDDVAELAFKCMSDGKPVYGAAQ